MSPWWDIILSIVEFMESTFVSSVFTLLQGFYESRCTQYIQRILRIFAYASKVLFKELYTLIRYYCTLRPLGDKDAAQQLRNSVNWAGVTVTRGIYMTPVNEKVRAPCGIHNAWRVNQAPRKPLTDNNAAGETRIRFYIRFALLWYIVLSGAGRKWLRMNRELQKRVTRFKDRL